MVPADGDPRVVEALVADEAQVGGRVADAPVLAGRRLEPVAQVGPAEESLRGPVRGARAAGDPLHLGEARRTEGAGAQADRDRPAGGDLQPRRQRLVVPGPGIMGPLDGRHLARLRLDGPQAQPGIVGGSLDPRRLEAAVRERGTLDPDVVPDQLLAVDEAPLGLDPRPHQAERDGARSGRREPAGGRAPAETGHRELEHVPPRPLRFGNPVHPHDRPAALENMAIVQRPDLVVGLDVEPRQLGQLDGLLARGRRYNRRDRGQQDHQEAKHDRSLFLGFSAIADSLTCTGSGPSGDAGSRG